jgi:hypothetical protein
MTECDTYNRHPPPAALGYLHSLALNERGCAPAAVSGGPLIAWLEGVGTFERSG